LGPNGTRFVGAFSGPKKSQFSGPTPSNAPRNAVALLKTITNHAIKTTGTLIFKNHESQLCNIKMTTDSLMLLKTKTLYDCFELIEIKGTQA
jgi:hypothetical protein